ncbi:prepilin-type N-terminal cleavage/methylation domain-containing protein [Psychrobacter sp. 16-MNA-CIBAN-0192]|uniref:type IV pilin protein n=1 Tax=Psychrobacter sp. 16-MNA-CIBAN-0192 TaxID=3140448 RepID=UPI00331EBDDA
MIQTKASIRFKPQSGFTLIELMITLAIIGILATIAYPTYQRHVIKTKRTDMMSEINNIASQIEGKKVAKSSYTAITAAELTPFTGDYPKQGTALYNVIITPSPITALWTISAAPKPGTQMAGDGTLSLNHQGIKCRNSVCGTNEEWN